MLHAMLHATAHATAHATTMRARKVRIARTTEAPAVGRGVVRAPVRAGARSARCAASRQPARGAPGPEVEEEEGSVLDFPEEYVRAVPSRRPDIFPDLKEQKTPMPKKMPGDPEAPDEESEEKERKENPGEPGEKPEDEEEEEKEKKKKKKEKEEEE